MGRRKRQARMRKSLIEVPGWGVGALAALVPATIVAFAPMRQVHATPQEPLLVSASPVGEQEFAGNGVIRTGDPCDSASVIALDCTLGPGLDRPFHKLNDRPDLNDDGLVAYSDILRVIKYDSRVQTHQVFAAVHDLATGRFCTGPLYFGGFGPGARIINRLDAQIAWQARVWPCADGRFDDCQDPICDIQPCPIIPNVFGEAGAVNCRFASDFELLDDGPIAYTGDDAGSCDDVEHPDGIVIFDEGQRVVIVGQGDNAPGGGKFDGCGELTFGGLSSGTDRPFAFHAHITAEPGCLAIPSLINNYSIPRETKFKCGDAFFSGLQSSDEPRYIQPLWDTKPDVGCVTSCSEESPIVFIAELAKSADCDPSQDAVEALIEADLGNGPTTILLETGIRYRGIGDNVLCDMQPVPHPHPGFRSTFYGPSASVTPALGLDSAHAVFAGHYSKDRECPSKPPSVPAIFVCSGVAEVSILVQAGDPLPAPFADRVFTAFGSPVINTEGQVVFWAESSVPAGDDRHLRGGIFLYELNKDDSCVADINRDLVVNPKDLAILLGAWGPNPGNPADLNCDGMVDPEDLAILLGAWGPCS